MLVSAIHQHGLVIGIHISALSWASFPPHTPHPTTLGCHRVFLTTVSPRICNRSWPTAGTQELRQIMARQPPAHLRHLPFPPGSLAFLCPLCLPPRFSVSLSVSSAPVTLLSACLPPLPLFGISLLFSPFVLLPLVSSMGLGPSRSLLSLQPLPSAWMFIEEDARPRERAPGRKDWANDICGSVRWVQL